MIYICEGLKNICSLPCILCKCLDNACRSCCKAMNAACGETCKAIKEVWSPIVDNPLASYVLGTWVIQLIVICAGVYSFSDIDKDCASGDESSSSTDRTFVYVYPVTAMVFAIIHMSFAFYIQRRLVAKIEQMADDPIKDVVWYLLKYDIGFCLYFFFAGACPAVMSYLWYEIPDDCEGNVNMGGGAVLFLAWMYVVLEFFYCCCFVCGAGAKDKAGKLKKRTIEDGAPPAEQVGPTAPPAEQVGPTA